MAAKKQTKIFVLDTNVILHDHTCIYQFQENDIVIPITVLEELDKFKRGNDPINFQAREFVRELDELIGDHLLNGGIQLGADKGNLSVETGKPFPEELKQSFREDIPDHRILAIAMYIAQKSPSRHCILVTKDINLRIKAKSLKLLAEDYYNDKVKDIQELNKCVTEFENFDDVLIDRLYKDNTIPVELMGFDRTPDINEYFIMKSAKASVLGRYDGGLKKIVRVEKKTAYGIKPRNAEQTFSLDALFNPEIKLVALTGKAGTGKTLLALAAALEQYKSFGQIMLARPIVALSNRDLGFLPGDAQEKISPYMQPLFDNLAVIKHGYNARSMEYQKIEELLKDEKLIITPLAYIRGRSLSNSYFIIDEAQNLTPHEIKTIITRAGEGTKLVFTGDLQQIDSPYLDMTSNGLAYMTEKMKNHEIFAHVNLVKGERSYLAELASDLL
ncbi:MAG TPA: ribonuclease [Prolixibacteraceae bacterium]|jgi:PhoH-like ATPase|nr:ribonuclease [Prolixibacteraceae bacterium]